MFRVICNKKQNNAKCVCASEHVLEDLGVAKRNALAYNDDLMHAM